MQFDKESTHLWFGGKEKQVRKTKILKFIPLTKTRSYQTDLAINIKLSIILKALFH